MEKDKIASGSIRMIVIGGSAGSFKAVFTIFTALKTDFTIPILLVLHRDPQGASRLSEVLAQRTRLLVKEVEDKETMQPRHIYVAPADYHVLLESDGTISLDYSEKEHFSRPSIDVSFKSASDVYNKELACVLLSGANSDGAQGLKYVKVNGGFSIVQDPQDAEVSYMPLQAIAASAPDLIMLVREMGTLLNSLTSAWPEATNP